MDMTEKNYLSVIPSAHLQQYTTLFLWSEEIRSQGGDEVGTG